ncbi:unnamed protein product [Paramecium pentaurelia]|uniref:Uncharacterized protein n=1 Tax=Paramecium pentaurelia TaxID=43138 RepID=A0A8S1W2C5_9CILI|nr:unnamed protein product [Paramecium pentaurelia]
MGCGSSDVRDNTNSNGQKSNRGNQFKKEDESKQKDNNQVDGYFREEKIKKEKMLTLPREDRQFQEDGHNLDKNKEKKQSNKPTKAAF